MPNRLLLADEDPKTSRVLEVSLRGAGFEVTTVTTGAAAWVAIEEQLPQVVLAATDLAALDGFELCTRVRARQGGREVGFILLGSDDSLAHRIRSIEVGADDYLMKPPYVQEVVARVKALVQRRDRESFTSSARAAEAFAGQLADLSVVDLLQVVSDSRRSGIVHLRGAREAPATIYFRQGQIVDAEVGRLSGLNAISRLFSWPTGSFEVHWKPIRRPNAIGLPTAELVLEGMKRLDERNRLAGGLPDLNGVFEVNYRVLAERLSEIPDEVNTVLRLFDGARTLADVVEDCQLPDPKAMAIAIRLRDEGIIHNVSRPGAADQGHGQGKEGGLVVPPRPPNRQPGADDVTVVRRITSLGIGSGPVQAIAAPAAAETVVGPPPSPPESFDDVDGVIPPEHHAKTDPGLGKPLDFSEPTSTSSEYALVETGAIAALPDGEASARRGDEVTAPNDLGTAPPQVPLEIQRRITEPVAPLDPPAEPAPADEEVPPASVPISRTQLGLGPFADLPPEQVDPFDSSVADALALLDAFPPPPEPSTPVAAEPAPESLANGVPAEPPPSASPAAAVPADEPAPPPEPAAARPPSGEPTMRMDVPGDALSPEEELEALGIPTRKRGARIVVAIAVVGALGAVAVHKLRGSAAPHAPPSAPAEQAAAPPSPPSVPAAQAVAPPSPAAEPAPPAPGPAIAEKPPTSAPPTETPPAVTAGKAPEKAPVEKEAPPAAAPAEKPRAARVGAASQNPVAAAAPSPGAAPSVAKPAAPPADFARQLATCRGQFLRSRMREAAITCAAALEANPNSADALTMMAHVELNRGRLGHANELAQKSIAIDPNQADAYVIIGGVHQDSGRNAQAKVAYRRYLQLAPHGRYADELRSIVGSL